MMRDIPFSKDRSVGQEISSPGEYRARLCRSDSSVGLLWTAIKRRGGISPTFVPMPAHFSMTKDEQLTFLRLPVKLRGTYVTWLMGYNPYFLMSRETYYRHKRELLSTFGIDIAHRV